MKILFPVLLSILLFFSCATSQNNDTAFHPIVLKAKEISLYTDQINWEEVNQNFTDLIKDKDDLERLNELSIELGTYTSKLVRGNGKNTISWTTPSGFKVNYRCFTTRQLSAKGNIKGIGRIEHRGVEETDFPDARGYASGISPNFVHSMDGSHMAIVVDNWDRDFAAVHDAFAVHAPLVGELLHITKEAFIAIYDVDNFYDYIEETILSSTDNLDLEQPLIGNLSIEDVRDSDYFFA